MTCHFNTTEEQIRNFSMNKKMLEEMYRESVHRIELLRFERIIISFLLQ